MSELTAGSSPYLRLAEAAEYLRCSAKHFRRHVLPSLDPIRVGVMLLFTRAELDAWAEGQRRGGAAADAPVDRHATPAAPARSAHKARATTRARDLTPQAKVFLRKLRET